MDLSRQISFLDSKFKNLKDFSSKKIILIGCGGVGSPLAELLVRGGFSNISLIDFDVIDNSNLQRQLFTQKDLGNFKVTSLKNRLLEINSKTTIKESIEQISQKNISSLCSNADLILDATDNFETRFLINQFCKENNVPWIYSGAIKSEIICCLFQGKRSSFENIISKDAKNEDCSVGVLASTTFIAASLVYNEILRYFLEDKYESKLIKFNIWNKKIFEIKV